MQVKYSLRRAFSSVPMKPVAGDALSRYLSVAINGSERSIKCPGKWRYRLARETAHVQVASEPATSSAVTLPPSQWVPTRKRSSNDPHHPLHPHHPFHCSIPCHTCTPGLELGSVHRSCGDHLHLRYNALESRS